jgi:hypothetical protein
MGDCGRPWKPGNPSSQKGAIPKITDEELDRTGAIGAPIRETTAKPTLADSRIPI